MRDTGFMTIGHWKYLQQILFFREFDIPLKEIKAVLENLLLKGTRSCKCRENVGSKKERMEHLIAALMIS